VNWNLKRVAGRHRNVAEASQGTDDRTITDNAPSVIPGSWVSTSPSSQIRRYSPKRACEVHHGAKAFGKLLLKEAIASKAAGKNNQLDEKLYQPRARSSLYATYLGQSLFLFQQGLHLSCGKCHGAGGNGAKHCDKLVAVGVVSLKR
jgi:hypothetical protein